jgi:hypothetical protein
MLRRHEAVNPMGLQVALSTDVSERKWNSPAGAVANPVAGDRRRLPILLILFQLKSIPDDGASHWVGATHMPSLKSVVLRIPGEEGDFKFYVAKFQQDDADRLAAEIAEGSLDPDRMRAFGAPLDLKQTMHRLDTRDFYVIDIAPPGHRA